MLTRMAGPGDNRDADGEALLPTLTLSVLGIGRDPVTPIFDDSMAVPDTAAEREGARPRGARSGDVIDGRYVVEGQLGRGAMGRVMRVRHQVLGKPFALKLIKAPIAADPRVREMFYREARLASACNHDNICSIVDFGQDPRFGLFMVMELLAGQTVFNKLQQDGPIAPKAACDIMWGVCEALRYIHARGIIHGDIKGENIFLVRGPSHRRMVKLLDFGLSRPDLGRGIGEVDGTPPYLAPERIRGGPASVASDIYALGIVFFEILTGDLPFIGNTLEEIFELQKTAEMPAPSSRIDEPLDERADQIVARATRKDPRDRHPDVAAFMYELRTLMNMLGMETARRRPSPGADSGRERREHDQRLRCASEVFLTAPLPLASVDVTGRVRVANRAFFEFLGHTGEATEIDLRDSGLLEVYPTLLADLELVHTRRVPVKRAIVLAKGGGEQVEVAVLLTPSPTTNEVTAGDLHLALHPLRGAP